MENAIHSIIAGAFTGFHGDAIFKLSNGQVWQQKRYKYKYKYVYRPNVTIRSERGEYLLAVDGMDEEVAVLRASLVEEGTIVSDFSGFSQEARFQFSNGHVWVPEEYKYQYHYSHRPEAMVIDGKNGLELHVEGMSDTLRVRRS